MFCTSLSKPQTMEINMPSKDNVTEDQQNKVKASDAITIILGGEDKVFYYTGLPNYEDPKTLVETNYTEDGLRSFLLSRNANVVNKMNVLKQKKAKEEISEEDFKKQSIEIKGDKNAPVVMIKAMDEATYKNLIDVLDEMQICNIGKYAIVDIQDGDKYLVANYLGLIPAGEQQAAQ